MFKQTLALLTSFVVARWQKPASSKKQTQTLKGIKHMKTLGRMHARTLTDVEINLVGAGGIHVTSVSITVSLSGPDAGVSIDL
jgi:hypothetical protein